MYSERYYPKPSLSNVVYAIFPVQLQLTQVGRGNFNKWFSSLIPTHTPSLFLQEDFPEHTHHNLVFSLHQSLSWHRDLLLLPRDYHLLSQCMNEQSMNAILTLESLQNAVKSFSRPTVTSNQVYSLSDSNPFSATGKMCGLGRVI